MLPDRRMIDTLKQWYPNERVEDILKKLEEFQAGVGLNTMVGELSGDQPSRRCLFGINLRPEGPIDLKGLAVGRYLIGRGPMCAISLDRDTTISRVHAQLTVHPDGKLTLSHISEKSPTWINDKAFEGLDYEIQDTDRIRVGNTTLHFLRPDF